MPKSKRAARLEQDEALSVAAKAAEPAVPSEDEDERDVDDEGSAAPVSAFAALSQLQEDVAEPSDDEEEVQTSKPKRRKNKKKAKKTTDAPSTTASPARSKPAKADEDLDEIDKALRDIAVQNSEPVPVAGPSSAMRSLLAVETKHLDADAELKRMFGSKIINSTAHKTTQRGAIASNPHHAASARLRSSLAKPEQYWPPIQFVRSGLTMEQQLSTDGSTPTHSFVHSKAYKEAQAQFLDAVASADGDALFALLQVFPYHIDTLLQVSEMNAHQGDMGQADDMTARALYSFERAFAPTFSITQGNATLDFRKTENRAMWRAIERKTSSLIKRGCWRTAFEFSKLLLQLDPVSDPYGALLFIEFLAPKAKQGDWLDSLMQDLPSVLGEGPDALRLDAYPGLAFAHALATFDREGDSDHAASTKLLRSAILRFPMLILPLFDKLQLSWPKEIADLPRGQLRTSYERTPGFLLHTLSHFYVHRSSDLWRPDTTKAWLLSTVRSTFAQLSDSSDPDVQFGESLLKPDALYGGNVPAGIVRHIMAADVASMRAFLPPKALSQTSYSYDLLPPQPGSGVTFYDDAYFSEAGGRRRGGPAGGRDGAMRALMDGLRRAGVIGEDVDQEQLAAMLHEQAVLQGQNGGMPGGFDQQEGESDEEEEEQQPRGGLYDALAGLLGRQPAREA